VNNAGTSEPIPALEETTAHFAATLRVNLIAPFELARDCAQAMTSSGTRGSIVNVASIWGMVGVGQIPEAGYAASKGGLVNLTRELAAQWARKDVRVNTLAPGWFRTEMTDGVMFGDERGEKWLKQRTPMGRGGHDDELDGALLFLASDASSFVTGQILCVDGGWTSV
jgi:NAD(P)-dependent dehydrogenase (short-subunit alcohol dehydrogenase family)